MAVNIDYLMQDGEALLKTVDTNHEAMNAKGYTQTAYDAFAADKEELRLKELAQQKAVKHVAAKTAEQNRTIVTITEAITQVRNSAKSSYGNDQPQLKQFKIGEQMPVTVSKLRTHCEYLMTVVNEHHVKLLENGLTQADIDLINSAAGLLVGIDADQETAKKLQVSATIQRDAAAKAFKERMFKVRSFAKAAFAKNPEILVQFDPIPKPGGGKKPGGETPPEGGSPTPPTTT